MPRDFKSTPSEYDTTRTEVIGEMRIAFACHEFQCDPIEDPEICRLCRRQAQDDLHLRRHESTYSLIADILGDIPISQHIIGGRRVLVIDPIGVAEHEARRAGLVDDNGYPIERAEPAPMLLAAE